MSEAPIIRVVDDDPSFRTAVTRLLRAAKYPVRGFASASEFLDSDPCTEPGCIAANCAASSADPYSGTHVLPEPLR